MVDASESRGNEKGREVGWGRSERTWALVQHCLQMGDLGQVTSPWNHPLSASTEVRREADEISKRVFRNHISGSPQNK